MQKVIERKLSDGMMLLKQKLSNKNHAVCINRISL